MKILLLILLLIILLYLILILYTNIEIFSEENIYYGSECKGDYFNDYFVYLLKLAYPNKNIIFSNDEKAQIIIK